VLWRNRALALITVVSALAAGVLAAPAWASDQFTLDAHPDSFGAIVTDASGNAYITWNQTASPVDVPTFCKLAPGAHRCTYRVGLSVPGAPDTAASLQPFPILLPNGVVLVAASRYIDDDTLWWSSSNGGQSFSGPHEIPYLTSADCPTFCYGSYSYSGLSNVDDLVPTNWTNNDLYDQGKLTGLVPGSETAGGVPYVGWIESSFNVGLGYNWNSDAEAGGGGAGATAFTFANPGSFVAGSTIGVSGFGSASSTAASDWVEAYWTETTPYSLNYYYYSPPSAFANQSAWSGPHSLGVGYEPRLAGGSAGLFLLSADSPSGAGDPGVVQIHRYDPATHAFESPLTIANESDPGTYLFVGGGLGENLDTGELAAVWPQIGGSGGDMLRLYLSSDGGKHFSTAQYIASAPAFASADNSRVAIANNGTGFVTFRDASGLQVADLYPTSAQYKKLHANKHGQGDVVNVPVTCPAASGKCKITISLAGAHGRHTLLASQHFTVRAGATSALNVHLNSTGVHLLTSGHGRFSSILTPARPPRGGGSHTVTAHVTIKH